MPTLILPPNDIGAQAMLLGVGVESSPAKYGTLYELIFDHVMGAINEAVFPVIELHQKAGGVKFSKVGPAVESRPKSTVLLQAAVRYGTPARPDFTQVLGTHQMLDASWTLELEFDRWVSFDNLVAVLNSKSTRYASANAAEGFEQQIVLVNTVQPRHPKPGNPESGSRVTISLTSKPASQAF